MPRISCKVKFEPRDLWIGAYWNTLSIGAAYRLLEVYICIIPLLPLKLTFEWGTDPRIKAHEPYNLDASNRAVWYQRRREWLDAYYKLSVSAKIQPADPEPVEPTPNRSESHTWKGSGPAPTPHWQGPQTVKDYLLINDDFISPTPNYNYLDGPLPAKPRDESVNPYTPTEAAIKSVMSQLTEHCFKFLEPLSVVRQNCRWRLSKAVIEAVCNETWILDDEGRQTDKHPKPEFLTHIYNIPVMTDRLLADGYGDIETADGKYSYPFMIQLPPSGPPPPRQKSAQSGVE